MPRLLVVTTIRVAFTISVLSRQYAGLSGQAYWRLSSTPLANQLRWVSAAGRLWLQDSPCWPSCRCPCWDIGHGSLIALRSEEHTSELQSQSNLVCRLLLEKKKTIENHMTVIAHCEIVIL